MLTLIKNGFVIDPMSNREGIYDVLMDDGIIKRVEQNIAIGKQNDYQDRNLNNVTIIDATGKYIMPGFIDLHVHLREPGYEYKETIKTGMLAAAAGGYTSICPMPNTKPTTDKAIVLQQVLGKAKEEAMISVYPIGAITIDQEGYELADIGEMVKAGAVAISEDGKSVMDTALYYESMKIAAQYNIPIFAHCEDKSLAGKGVINAGSKAEELQLEGISNAVEDVIVARDILLAKETGVKLHLCHCSTRDSVKMIDIAKKDGLPVTGEVCPHHFILSDQDISLGDANFKMNPPLRAREDVIALKEALRDDIIDVIATDHAPHSEEEKSKPFAQAPFGIVGLETAFALTVTELVKTGYLTLRQMVEKMSVNPAKILGIDRGCIDIGKVADLVITDLDQEYIIDKNTFYSKGKNTPFHGRKVVGRVEYTFVEGKMVYTYDATE